jgi:hypothetical protein|tara:strand:- start:243 stop:404 length:162 start_codon:yes stop_codon:yes gene_type:complete
MEEIPQDLWADMATLNALYEELCWDHDDVLEFVPDYENNRIIIQNKTMNNARH